MRLILMMGLALLFYLLNIRCCPFFILFHLPCPGCGMTRSLLYLFQGNLALSFQYNPLGLFIAGLIGIELFFLSVNKQTLLDSFLKRHIKIIFGICIIVQLLLEIHNIYNPLLY